MRNRRHIPGALRAWLLCVPIVMTPGALFAQTGLFAGVWKNADPNTRSLTTARIDTAESRVVVTAWGKCHPKDCRWGVSEATAYGPSVSGHPASTTRTLSVAFVRPASETLLILRPGGSDRLQFELLTRYTDQSNRGGVVETGTLLRVTALNR